MSKNQLLATGLLFLVSTALSFLLLEQAYRFYLFGWDSFSIEKINSIHGIGVSGLITPSEQLEVIFELKPNLNTYFKLARFRTNSHGLRDREYKLQKPENTYRIAVIGDSFTMPAGVEIEDSYHSLVEENLNRNSGDTTYQLINFGVGGYNLRQYMAVIKHKAQKYSPDLIIVGFCPWNDHNIPSHEIFERRYKVKPATHPFFQSFVIEGFIAGIRNAKKSNTFRTTTFSDKQKVYLSKIFSEMADYSSQSNVSIIIVNISHLYNERYSGELKNLVLENGLYFADLSLPFKGTDFDEFKIYRTDHHPNRLAHRIFANGLYAYLRGFMDTHMR